MARAGRRLRARPDLPMSEVLLDQSVAAGAGNVYRSEALFLSRVDPARLASALSDEALESLFAVTRKLMSANIGNATIVLGKRWFGVSGAIVAFLGLFALPLGVALTLAAVYADLATHPTVGAVVTGVGVAGAGLILGTAIKLARPIARNPAALALVAACVAGLAFARLSLFIVLPVVLAAALILARKKLL